MLLDDDDNGDDDDDAYHDIGDIMPGSECCSGNTHCLHPRIQHFAVVVVLSCQYTVK